MVYTIIVILLVLWLLGFSLSVGGNLIHALLFFAALVLLYNFLHPPWPVGLASESPVERRADSISRPPTKSLTW